MVCIRYRKSTKRALIKSTGRVGLREKNQRSKSHLDVSKFPEATVEFNLRKNYKENISTIDLNKLYSDRLPQEIGKTSNFKKLSEQDAAIVESILKKYPNEITEDNVLTIVRDPLNKFQWESSQVMKKISQFKSSQIHKCEMGRCLCGESKTSSNYSRSGC
jgi:hypothetical protein